MDRLNVNKLFSNLCCSNCGQDFDKDSIFVLREEDNLFVLQVVCPVCKKSFGVAFLGMESLSVKDSDKSDEKYALQVKDLPEPINSDDVIDAHRFIKNMGQDWQKYIPEEYK